MSNFGKVLVPLEKYIKTFFTIKEGIFGFVTFGVKENYSSHILMLFFRAHNVTLIGQSYRN